MSLDEVFGVVLTAVARDRSELGDQQVPCAPEELNSRPESLVKLDERSVPALKALMSQEVTCLSLVNCVYAQTPILWAVDRNGDIWLALEEIVTKHSRRYLRPRIRGLNPGKDETRLGHPSLVEGEGRIGGELVYDLGWGILRPGWKLTNSSGRFGAGLTRKSTHLENVRDRFSDYGIDVEPIFLR